MSGFRECRALMRGLRGARETSARALRAGVPRHRGAGVPRHRGGDRLGNVRFISRDGVSVLARTARCP